MAFKHIQSNRYVYLLTSEGVPVGIKVRDEDAPAGSLLIDRTNGQLYILRQDGKWHRFGQASDTTPIREQFNYHADNLYELAFLPEPNSLRFFVNTVKPVEGLDFNFSPITNTITWIGNSSNPGEYSLDSGDLIEVFYDTKEI